MVECKLSKETVQAKGKIPSVVLLQTELEFSANFDGYDYYPKWVEISFFRTKTEAHQHVMLAKAGMTDEIFLSPNKIKP
jgi:hypothetical protein